MARSVRLHARAVALALAIGLLGSLVTVLDRSPARADAAGTVSAAVAWLRTQQQPDGGFEVAGFTAFETIDAVYALAQAAQTGGSWSTAQARAGVLGTTTAGGATPLDYLDAYAAAGIANYQAAKLIALVTNPLGLDPATFDPSGDGVTDLVSIVGTPGDDDKFGISTAALNRILLAVWAYGLTNGSVPSDTIDVVRECKRMGTGDVVSWTFNCDTSDGLGDVDTTSYAILSLLAAGVADDDADLVDAAAFLTDSQQANGAWQSFGSDDPNSTAIAMQALGALDGFESEIADAAAWLETQQDPDGHIATQFDGFGVNTFATAQAIQGLVHRPVPRATSFVDPTTVPASTGSGALTVETGTGSLADVAAIAPTSLPAAPAGVSFPLGLLSFRVTGLTPGATAEVRVVLPLGTSLSKYWKLVGGTWSDFTSHASFSGNVVTLTLVDGGAGDSDGTANGVIVDPGGAAFVSAQTPVTDPTSDPAPTLVVRFAG